MKPNKNPPINKVIDFVASSGYGPQAVKITTERGTPILSPDTLAFTKKNYYSDVPNMSLDTLRRERNLDIIPQMTIEQLRTLSDELYLTKNQPELVYLHRFLNENGDFPRRLNFGGGDLNFSLPGVFWVKWSTGGNINRPSNLYDNILRASVQGNYDFWHRQNERKFFENVYRVLLRPIPNPIPEEEIEYGGRRTKRTKRRKTRKSRKNKRKTKRRRA